MLIVVRHGRTAANAAMLLQGRADHPLDDVGRAQAARLAAAVGPVAAIVASPLKRAQQTAAAFGQEVTTDDRWVELDYGDLEGAPIASVPAETWRQWRTDPDFVPAGGESHAQMQSRVVESGRELLAGAARDGDVVVVSHVGPIKALIAWALDLAPSSGWRFHLNQASVTRVAMGAHGPVLHSFNESQHLQGL